ncbi:MAG: c-type cytochrome, partial [Planctomycetaceae bacterium]|nr:c-type cytochrome [Planctomycetaceae bacterium]
MRLLQRLRATLFLCGTLLIGMQTRAESADSELFFRDRVAPIFQKRCLSCHNKESKKGELSLQTRKAALAGGESGEVIVPGNPDGSYLLSLITASKGQAEMPKDADPLSNEEVASIRQWIEQGAKWPAGFQLEPKLADRNWWSLQPLHKPRLPGVSHAELQW